MVTDSSFLRSIYHLAPLPLTPELVLLGGHEPQRVGTSVLFTLPFSWFIPYMLEVSSQGPAPFTFPDGTSASFPVFREAITETLQTEGISITSWKAIGGEYPKQGRAPEAVSTALAARDEKYQGSSGYHFVAYVAPGQEGLLTRALLIVASRAMQAKEVLLGSNRGTTFPDGLTHLKTTAEGVLNGASAFRESPDKAYLGFTLDHYVTSDGSLDGFITSVTEALKSLGINVTGIQPSGAIITPLPEISMGRKKWFPIPVSPYTSTFFAVDTPEGGLPTLERALLTLSSRAAEARIDFLTHQPQRGSLTVR